MKKPIISKIVSEISSEKQYRNEAFQNIDQGEGVIDKSDFEGCVFENCNFQQSVFSKCLFESCTFVRCNLGLIKIQDVQFQSTQYSRCKMIGIDWTGLGLSFDMKFEDCVLDDSIFAGLDIRNIEMIRCKLRGVDFTDTNLTDAVFHESDFKEARFINTNLTKADFSGAFNYSIKPDLNNLKRTKFSLSGVIGLLEDLDIIIK